MCVGWNAWTFGMITDLWKMLSSIGHLSLGSLSTYNWAAVQLPSAMSVSSDVNIVTLFMISLCRPYHIALSRCHQQHI